MALEDLAGPSRYLDALNRAWPELTDQKLDVAVVAGHIPGIKNVLLNTFPKLNGPVDYDATEMSNAILWALHYTVPIGGVIIWSGEGGALDLTRWAICNGQELSRTTYAALFAICGVVYGAGDGSTTFNVPDLRLRVPENQDNSQGIMRGNKRGADSVTLTVDNLPPHRHNLMANTSVGSRGSATATSKLAKHLNSNDNDEYFGAVAGGDANAFESSAVGGGQAVNVMSPRLAMLYAIRML